MARNRSINDINKRTSKQYTPMQQSQTVQDYSPNAQVYHAAAKGGKKGKKPLVIALCAILVVLLGAGTAFAMYVANIDKQLKGNKTEAEQMAIQEQLSYHSNFNEVFYMLLIGSDAREEGEPSRSDVNIVCRVDPVNNKLSLLSIPRDTKVEVDGHGTQKFNTAYAFDKVPGVIKATEKLVDIPISHYAEINFGGLKDLVNAVGGVTVENESKIDDDHCDDGDGEHYVIEEGTQRLDGGQALTFARTRHYAMGDFVRTSHQRKLIEAIIDEVRQKPITEIPGIIEAAAKCASTDISLADLVGLAQQFKDTDNLTIYEAMLPSYTQNINGISFVINDEEKTKEMLEKFKAGEDPSGIVSNKSASDINDKSIDTSKVILFDDDEEVTSGKKKSNASSINQDSGSSDSGSSNNNSGSTGGEGSEDDGTEESSGSSGENGSATAGSGDSGSSGAGSGDSGSSGAGSGDSGSSGAGSGDSGSSGAGSGDSGSSGAGSGDSGSSGDPSAASE